MCPPTAASSYSEGLVGGPGARPVTSAPSDCSHSDSHAPLKPVWPVTRTRRRLQKSESIPTTGGYLHAISGASASTAPAVPPTAEILGIPLAISDYQHVMDWMERTVAAGVHGYLTAAAGNLGMSAQEDRETLAAVLGAPLAGSAGEPRRWGLRV